MDLETLLLSEVSQKEKDNYQMISLRSGISYMAQMNLSTDKKLMDVEIRRVVAKGEGGRGMDWGFGVHRCRQLPLEWISDAIPLGSTGNSVPSLMMGQDGR